MRLRDVSRDAVDGLLELSVVGSFSRVGFAARRRLYRWPAHYARLDGEVAVVTGATSGLGREVATSFARLGAHVVLIVRDAQRGSQARDDIIACTGNSGVEVVVADLGDLNSVRTAAAQLRRFAAIHVLVHNAGSLERTREVSAQGIELTAAVHLLGPFLLTRMIMTLITQRLVEKLNPKENQHRLLMLIDEFPRLGKLPFFTEALPILAGYHIKAMLVMQSKAQLDAPEAYGHGNTIIEGCKVRSVYTPQDPVTAQWISDALGPKTEVHQQTTFTGHRLAPWLGHVMVADQESARPLLDAAEICKMSPKEMILLVAGFPPIRARRLKYYEHPELANRAGLPPVKLNPKGPYPYRPPPHPNPWAGKVTLKQRTDGVGAPPAAAPAAAPPGPSESDSSEHSRLAIALPARQAAPESEEELLPPGRKRAQCDIEQQLELLISEEELTRRRALDEFENETQAPHHRIRRRIPF